jgi:histone deacetylase 1/2
MAQIKKKKKIETPPLSTASLPDIVFMLLFFFMVTTTMREVTLLVKLKKAVYGLCNAPRAWYEKLRAALLELGARRSRLDPCIFYVLDKNQTNVIGHLGIHVDDIICGGTAEFESFLDKLRSIFPFGSWERDAFRFTGLELRQREDFSIEVTQKEFIHKLRPAELGRARRADTHSRLTAAGISVLRGILGSLQLLTTNTRPDLACPLCLLQGEIETATVDTLLRANKLVREAKATTTSVDVKGINFDHMQVLCYSDAGWANRPNGGSQGAYIILLTTCSVLDNQPGDLVLLDWSSSKLPRVAKSTLAAETQSYDNAADGTEWIRTLFVELTDPNSSFGNSLIISRSTLQKWRPIVAVSMMF